MPYIMWTILDFSGGTYAPFIRYRGSYSESSQTGEAELTHAVLSYLLEGTLNGEYLDIEYVSGGLYLSVVSSSGYYAWLDDVPNPYGAGNIPTADSLFSTFPSDKLIARFSLVGNYYRGTGNSAWSGIGWPPQGITISVRATRRGYTYTYNLTPHDGTVGHGGTAGTISSKVYTYAGSSISVTFGSSGLGLTTAQKPTRTGYILGGWGTSSSSTTNKASVTIFSPAPTSNQSSTVYAIWIRPTYTYNFDGNNGTLGTVTSKVYTYADTSISVSFGAGSLGLTTTPQRPTRDGYIFYGWADSASSETGKASVTIFSSAPTSNQISTIYAYWNGFSYWITYDGNGNDGGSDPGQTEGMYSDSWTGSVTLRTSPGYTRSNHTFEGWGETADATTTISSLSFWSTASPPTTHFDKTVYAIWSANGTTITFKKRTSGETGDLPSSSGDLFTSGSSLPDNELSRDYYQAAGDNISGWNTSSGTAHANLTADAWVFSMSSSTIDLYGKFRPNKFELTLKETSSDANSRTVTIEYSQNYHDYWKFYMEYQIPVEYTKAGHYPVSWFHSIVISPGHARLNDLDPNKIIHEDFVETIWPIWADVKENTFSYQRDGSTGGTQQDIDAKIYYGHDALVNLPTISDIDPPTRRRYTFLGYNENGDTSISYKSINNSFRYTNSGNDFEYIKISTGSSHGDWHAVWGGNTGGHGGSNKYTSPAGEFRDKTYIQYGYYGDWFIIKSKNPFLLSHITFGPRGGSYNGRRPIDYEFYGKTDIDSSWHTLITERNASYISNVHTSKKVSYSFNDSDTLVSDISKYTYFAMCVNKTAGDTLLNFKSLKIYGLMDSSAGGATTTPTFDYFPEQYHQPSVHLWSGNTGPSANTETILKEVWELDSTLADFEIDYWYDTTKLVDITATSFKNNDVSVTLTNTKHNINGLTQIGWSIDGKTYDMGHVILQNKFDDILQDYIVNEDHVIKAYAVYEANEYRIIYKKSATNTFYNNHYVPDEQIYYYHEIVNPIDSAANPTLKLKDLYIEYNGFRSIGWTDTDGTTESVVNDQGVIIKDKFQDTLNQNELLPSIDLFLIWEKIDYRIVGNSHNFETIYSPIYDDKLLFYPSVKRLNYIYNFRDANTISSLLTNGSVIPSTGDFLWTKIKDSVGLKTAYDFFYNSVFPSDKGLRNLQETYKKNSLIELTDVILLNHSSELPNVYNGAGPINPVYISNTNDYVYHMVDTVNDYTINLSKDSLCEILVVGGGGGGGGTGAGGGGGGGGGAVIHIPTVLLQEGSYTVSVGKGGDGAHYDADIISALMGDETIFRRTDNSIEIHAMGGGPSTRRDASNTNGQPGGSGGGAAAAENEDYKRTHRGGDTGTESSIKGTSGKLYQNKGGDTNWDNLSGVYTAGAGGGGAGKAAIDIDTGPGNGGTGIKINIDGNNYYWGGGGGGATGNRTNGGRGGKGGGGGGGSSNAFSAGTGGTNGRNNGANGLAVPVTNGGNGGANTGGGGGGADGLNANAGNGGSGIVILRIKEGYNFDHSTQDSSLFGSGVLQYIHGTVTRVDGIKEGDFNDGDGQIDYYWYGYFKAFETGKFTFSVETNDKISFSIGFETNHGGKLDLIADRVGSVSIQHGDIYLIKDVYYPFKIHAMSSFQSDYMKVHYKYEEQPEFSLNDVVDGLYYMKSFPGTTSMQDP